MPRLFWLFLAVGCAPSEPMSTETVTAVAEAPATAMAFTNDEGELVCPVMGDVIASPDRAASSLVHEGKTYYFCCSSCEEAFKVDPVHYADGSYLVSGDVLPSADAAVRRPSAGAPGYVDYAA